MPEQDDEDDYGQGELEIDVVLDNDDFDEEDLDHEDDEIASKKRVAADSIPLFNKTEEQLESFFDEFSILSKKKPDGPLNKFKVGILNHTLENANGFLKEDYRPFPDFQRFDNDDLPTASDVAMMLAQYLRSMNTYRKDHSFQDSIVAWNWYTSDGSLVRSKHPKSFKN